MTAETLNSGLKPNSKTIGRDILAGLIAAIAAIPDGMASAVLAGVNPVYGLYNLMVGTPVAALFTSSVYMAVINTSAMALVVYSALAGYTDGEEKTSALVVLTILVGAFQLLLGILKLGYLTRFISNSVMTGFLTGIAVIIILGQLGDFTGYSGEGNNKVAQTIDLLMNLDQIDLYTLAAGLITLALIVVLDRTRLSPVAMLIGLITATLLVAALGWDSVVLVGDTAEIPSSLPTPTMPDLKLVPAMIIPAVAIGIIGLIQASGVSQGYPNPGGKTPDASGDFRGQGLANIAAGFFRGLPLGGSLSGTALVVNAGAQSRWANVFTGIFVALGVLLFAGLIEMLPMTALAAILIYAGYQTIKPARIRMVWNTNSLSRVVMVVTFIFTLFLPVQQAVFVGVALQVILFVYKSAERMEITELMPTASGDYLEGPAPDVLPDWRVTMLVPHGSLFFAGASDFEEEAPSAEGVQGAVVVLVLRGRRALGSTALQVFRGYAEALQKGNGRLLLVDVNDAVVEQLERTGLLADFGPENILPQNPLLVASTKDAYDAGAEALASLLEERERAVADDQEEIAEPM